MRTFAFISFLTVPVSVFAFLRGLSQDMITTQQSQLNTSTYHWIEFTHFQSRFGKQYDSIDELTNRFHIFSENFNHIIKHNSDRYQNFTLGVNRFTDLTPSEFKQLYASGYKNDNDNDNGYGSFGCKSFSTVTQNPVSVDWRNKGVVNPVRDQGQCGSCWAFATTTNAESVWAISTGKLLDLSEEFLVDCASGFGYFNMGCNGGQMDSAFKYMINNGQCDESAYPYKAGVTKTAGTCQTCNPAPVHFSSCYDVASGNQLALESAVAKQPVTIAIEADTRYFQSYTGGILDAATCGTNLDHAVEIVGYGSENGNDYWTVRNSWGSQWGENGYVRIKRNRSDNDAGICGIAMEPSYLVV